MRPVPFLCFALAALWLSTGCGEPSAGKKTNPHHSRSASAPLRLDDREWKKVLPADVYYIARRGGTDRPFSSRYHDNHEAGTYYCAACGNALFSSDAKFESGTGWPSFYESLGGRASTAALPDADGYRVELRCARCEAHLGHLFKDGPAPTGLRYCINGTVLDFEARQ